jgi:hypothetical protein
VLGEACEHLWDRKVQHSIRLIRELEEQLNELERELDALPIPRDRE